MNTLSVIGNSLLLLGISEFSFADDPTAPVPANGFAKLSDETERAFKQEAAADFVAWYSTDGKLDIGVGRTDKKENLHLPTCFSLEELEDFFDHQKHKELIVVGIEKHVWTNEVLQRHIAKLRDYFVARGYAKVVIQQGSGGGRGIHLEHMAKPEVMAGLKAAPSEGVDGWKMLRSDDGSASIHLQNWSMKPDAVFLQDLVGFINGLPASEFPRLKSISFTLPSDRNLQKELLAEFSGNHANLLNEAQASAGKEHDMHNPKVLKLRDVLSQCLLATPTIKKIDEVLALHGYRISSVHHEKFALVKTTTPLSFYAGVWLNIGPKAEAMDVNRPLPPQSPAKPASNTR